MLYQATLPTKRALRLFPRPITDTGPAEDVSACRHAGILHLFQAQSALPVRRSITKLGGKAILRASAPFYAVFGTTNEDSDYSLPLQTEQVYEPDPDLKYNGFAPPPTWSDIDTTHPEQDNRWDTESTLYNFSLRDPSAEQPAMTTQHEHRCIQPEMAFWQQQTGVLRIPDQCNDYDLPSSTSILASSTLRRRGAIRCRKNPLFYR